MRMLSLFAIVYIGTAHLTAIAQATDTDEITMNAHLTLTDCQRASGVCSEHVILDHKTFLLTLDKENDGTSSGYWEHPVEWRGKTYTTFISVNKGSRWLLERGLKWHEGEKMVLDVQSDQINNILDVPTTKIERTEISPEASHFLTLQVELADPTKGQ